MARNHALNHYAKDLPEEASNTINQCLNIIQFGMKSTLIQFRGKYYVYCRAAKEGEVADKDVALAIGAYKSTFLAKSVAFYMFEKLEECFKMSKYRGIYHDGSLVVLTEQRTKKETQEWLRRYQSIVSKLAGGDYLQFTTKFWQPQLLKKRTHY
eukprot:12419754-Ditylum_brightwellii.AAC.1